MMLRKVLSAVLLLAGLFLLFKIYHVLGFIALGYIIYRVIKGTVKEEELPILRAMGIDLIAPLPPRRPVPEPEDHVRIVRKAFEEQ